MILHTIIKEETIESLSLEKKEMQRRISKKFLEGII